MVVVVVVVVAGYLFSRAGEEEDTILEHLQPFFYNADHDPTTTLSHAPTPTEAQVCRSSSSSSSSSGGGGSGGGSGGDCKESGT